MKLTTSIVRLLVGILFIVSGLVKANDPLGLAYKMEEFFEVWTTALAASGSALSQSLISIIHFLHPHTLTLSVVMITLEIVAGVAVIIGWRKKAILGLLLLLILFFTFLTGYAYASGKFKNCGCFGDCLPITPYVSFIKDVVLLLAILFLLFNQKHIQPFWSRNVQWAVVTFSLLGTLWLQWYVLNYLPLVDCLPFKKGADIAQGMKIDPAAIPDSFAIRFVYKKGGKQFEFSPESLPADLETYEYVDRIDKLIRKGNAEPAIKGFALTDSNNNDSTTAVLAQPLAVLYFIDGQKGIQQKAKETFAAVYNVALQKGLPVYVVTNGLEQVAKAFYQPDFPKATFFKIDFTTFKTAARTNPNIYLLKSGTIQNKWSGRQVTKAVEAIKAAQP
jgi:uncharacterized membrane protein YphA (DoxX/SURF4 family)